MSLRVLLYSVTNPGEAGGVQAVVRRLALHLRGRGHHVVIGWLTAGADLASPDEVYPLPRLRWRWRIPTPRSTLRALQALMALRRAIARHRPDVVNVHYVTCESIYFLLLRPFYRYQLVLSVHGSDALRPTRWDEKLLPRMLRCADAITAVSRPTAAKVGDYAGVETARVRLIPNGIDFGFWSERPVPQMPPEASPAQRPQAVLTVGRLLPVKGHDVLLRAFAMVRQRVPAARLVIVGGGAALPELQRLARELHLVDAVKFAGELDAAGVRAQLADARVFVLPSRSEGLPLALLEGMAAGVPAVATQVGGVPDVLVPGTGLMVPPEARAALAEAIANVLLDHELAAGLAERGRERASHFSAAVTVAAYEQLFWAVARPGTEGADARVPTPR